jgi:hypothetical protein
MLCTHLKIKLFFRQVKVIKAKKVVDKFLDIKRHLVYVEAVKMFRVGIQQLKWSMTVEWKLRGVEQREGDFVGLVRPLVRNLLAT